MAATRDTAPDRTGSNGAARLILTGALVAGAMLCSVWLTLGFADSGALAWNLTLASVLAVGLAVGAIIVPWHYGASRESAAAARADARLKAQAVENRLLRLAADALPDPLFVVDGENNCVLANEATVRRIYGDAPEAIGKPISDIVSPDNAMAYESLTRRARKTGRAQSMLHRAEPDDRPHMVRSRHIVLAGGPEDRGSVLIVEQDLSGVVSGQEQGVRMMDQLVRTLVKLLDGRDPYAAHHSAKVAIIAHAVTQELGLIEEMAAAAKTAGSLMNIGKILVPSEVLNRDGGLTEGEMRMVRDGIQASADLIDHIEFAGPVVDTLRQSTEKWDGSGFPRGLKEDEILVTAQAVALANSFVATISPRAFRGGVDVDEALAGLKREAGTTYGPDIVAALANRLCNRSALADLEASYGIMDR